MKLSNWFGDAFSDVELYFRENAPTLLVTAGVAGVVISGVMACVATRKVDEVLEEAHESIELVHTEQEGDRKELTKAYLNAGFDLVALYLPSVGLGALSIGCILTGHNILTRRNAAIVAAYTALDTTFKEYRSRVVSAYGEDAERKIRYNMQERLIEEEVTDEKGRTKKVKKKVQVAKINTVSDYARWFMPLHQDDPSLGSANWDKNEFISKSLIESARSWANYQLRTNGYVFLNEVYTLLGFQHSKAGQVVGWVYDGEDPLGDNYIKFEILDTYFEDINGDVTPAKLIDFNVDGAIVDKALKMELITQ